MSFQGSFDVRHLSHGRKYLLRELIYVDPEYGYIVIFAGYVSTLFGKRRTREWFWSKLYALGWGRCDRAEMLRDYLYNKGIAGCVVPNRLVADQIYKRAMTIDHISSWRKHTLYLYMRMCGSVLWKGWS